MAHASRISGFYKLPMGERRRKIAELIGAELDELVAALDEGLSSELADTLAENVIGTYALPFGVALNARVNGRDRLLPMVVEEPSVVAAASNAARMVRAAGGFWAEISASQMTAQIQVTDVKDAAGATQRLHQAEEDLLRLGRLAVPGLVGRGGGPSSLEVRDLGDGMLVLHVYVDCCDAMGANLTNQVAEALSRRTTRAANPLQPV